MKYADAKKKLEAGTALAVPRQVSWRVAAQLEKHGAGTLEKFVSRWCATLHPITQ